MRRHALLLLVAALCGCFDYEKLSSAFGDGGGAGGDGGAGPGAVRQLALLAGGLGGPGSLEGTGAQVLFSSPAAVVADGAGTLYVADSGNSVVRAVDLGSGVVRTVAGTAGQGGTADGLPGTGQLAGPEGLALAGRILYVADSGNHAIRRVDLDSGAMTTLAGSPGVVGASDGTGSAARFQQPFSVTTDGTTLWVADTGNHTIRAIALPGGAVTTLAGAPGMPGSTDGSGAAARFNGPAGVATDGNGGLYVADTGNHTIRRVSPQGDVTTFAGAAGQLGTADGAGSDARFDGPAAVVPGPLGLYVADGGGRTIRMVHADFSVETLAGRGHLAGTLDGVGTDGLLARPAGLGFDAAAGVLYVADSDAQAVRALHLGPRQLFTVAGVPGVAGLQEGSVTGARVDFPHGLARTPDGTIYLGDANWDRILAIKPDGTARFFAEGVHGLHALAADPSGNLFVLHDGTVDKYTAPAMSRSTISTAFQPGANGLTWNASVLYVADTSDNTVWALNVTGGPPTLLGGQSGKAGFMDGAAATSLFDHPVAVVVGPQGAVYVADQANYRIRKILTGQVTTFAGTGAVGIDDGGPTMATFTTLSHLAQEGTNTLLVLEDGRVRRINETTQITAAVPVTTRMRTPWNILPDGAGGFLIAQRSMILRRGAGGAEDVFIGATKNEAFVDGTGGETRFDVPRAIAAGKGVLFVADGDSSRIRVVEPDSGRTTTLVGDGVGDTRDGPLGQARIHDPTALAYDARHDVLYAYDGIECQVRAFALTDQTAATLAGGGPTGGQCGNHDDTGAAALFGYNPYTPEGLTTDGDNVYLADTVSCAIRRIEIATGVVTTLAGGPCNAGIVDDPTGTNARFDTVVGVTYDQATNSLYVTDATAVRQVSLTPPHAVLTVAGSKSQAGSADGVGTSARFTDLRGLDDDGLGHLLIADGGGTIRQLAIANGLVTTVAGQARKAACVPGPLPALLADPAGVAALPGGAFAVVSTNENAVLLAR